MTFPARTPLTRRALLGLAAGGGAAALAAATARPAAAAQAATIATTTWNSSRELTVRISTPALPQQVGVRVLLPASYASQPRRRYPVLYLLHGSMDNHSSWLDGYGARPVLSPAEIITVMPDGGSGGWYNDHSRSTVGRVDWHVFHTDHLVRLVDANLRTIARREGRAIAGFSMGGYGAALYGGYHSDLYAAVSTYSGATNGYEMAWRRAMYSAPVRDGENYGPIFGTTPGNEAADELWARDPGSYAPRLLDHRVRVYAGTDTNDSLESTIRASSRVYYDHLVAAGARNAAWTDIQGGHSWTTAVTELRTDLPGLLSHLAPAQNV